MFDRGDNRLECLIGLLYQTFKAAVSSIKHSGLFSPLSNIQGCCLRYQIFKIAASSIKHSRWLSPLKLSRLLSPLECLIEETAALNV
jgi:hypothetical protein